jgi:hypothetical protein
MLHLNKIFGEDVQKGKEMVTTGEKQGKIGRHHCSTLAGSVLFKGGYETEARHSNAHLSIYGMREAPAFVIKGDTPTFVIGNGMVDVPTFGIKGDAPRETRVSFTL